MRASFIHMADTHLGYEQYGVRERFNDFSRAFWAVVDDAIERHVDFVLIAGDLFNKRAIDALTLIHAIEGLRTLKTNNIPVIAIEGNHDRSFYREGTSWLQFLCYQDYLVLLEPMIEDGVPKIEPWQRERMQGAYYDVLGGRVRIYGMHWQGAATARCMDGMAQSMQTLRDQEHEEGVEYRLLMLHTGVDGYVPRIHGLPARGSFQPLQACIDYLALGHVHKPYEIDGWIYNPGSTETCTAEEIQWDNRGYYYVEIDTDEPDRIVDLSKKERVHHAEHIRSNRRPFVRHDVHVDGINEPDILYSRLEEYCRREGPRHIEAEAEKHPVVLLHLSGTLGFDAGSLDTPRMEEMVRHAFQPIYVRIDNNTNDQDYVPEDGELDGRNRALWYELERRIFEELVARDNRYLSTKEQWSTVIADLKQMALREDDPAIIAQFLREKRSALLK